MEYLMTYGWAILVVMIVGIVMWQLGIFNPSGTQAITMQGFGAVKPQLSGTGLRSDGTFTGTFLNAGGAPIYIKQIGVTMLEPGTGTVTKPFTTAVGSETPANEHIALTLGGVNTQGTPGDGYGARVEIQYTVEIGDTTVTKKSSGTIRGSLE